MKTFSSLITYCTYVKRFFFNKNSLERSFHNRPFTLSFVLQGYADFEKIKLTPRPEKVLQDLVNGFPDIFCKIDSSFRGNADASQAEKLRQQTASGSEMGEVVAPLQQTIETSRQVSVMHLAIENTEPTASLMDLAKGSSLDKKISEWQKNWIIQFTFLFGSVKVDTDC